MIEENGINHIMKKQLQLNQLSLFFEVTQEIRWRRSLLEGLDSADCTELHEAGLVPLSVLPEKNRTHHIVTDHPQRNEVLLLLEVAQEVLRSCPFVERLSGAEDTKLHVAVVVVAFMTVFAENGSREFQLLGNDRA